jgi:hypothetical protein
MQAATLARLFPGMPQPPQLALQQPQQQALQQAQQQVQLQQQQQQQRQLTSNGGGSAGLAPAFVEPSTALRLAAAEAVRAQTAAVIHAATDLATQVMVLHVGIAG